MEPAPHTGETTMPRNVVVVLLDSLNRHLLGCYGGTEFDTPTIDAFARRAVRFTSHRSGSLPCMPARHDLLVGNLDFLWRCWGSVEVWEEPITVPLRRAGITTKLVTDHPHLFETGGENYHADFSAWAYERGHEGDPWRTRPDPSWLGVPTMGRGAHTPYDDSRGWFRGEADFPGPRTMTEAARWVHEESSAAERFLLVVDEFDPHEPFDTPEPWASRYDPDWEGPHLIWPPYTAAALSSGRLTPAQARQIRAQYGAKLSMIDHWLRRLLDSLDATGRSDDTAVILCTDHGHYLGEHDLFGKPGVPVYEAMGHLPLLISWPGAPDGTTCDALTTTVDLHATLLDVFGVTTRYRTHGHSLAPLLDGTVDSVRTGALTGVWGREVHLVTAQHKLVRGAQGDDNAPLSMWSNRWSTMPVHQLPDLRLPDPDSRARLDAMPGSSIPVIRQPFQPGDLLPFWAYSEPQQDLAFDWRDDPDEQRSLVGEAVEAELVEHLRAELIALDVPDDQLERLGLG
jgi:arylsulfatase A-like enzyme